jgi:hypothetical protein
MTAGSWFLVVANYSSGVSKVVAFVSEQEALAAYAGAEARHRDARHVEVVLIASDDEDTLKRSYPHLFSARKASKKVALGMLDEVAYA